MTCNAINTEWRVKEKPVKQGEGHTKRAKNLLSLGVVFVKNKQTNKRKQINTAGGTSYALV